MPDPKATSDPREPTTARGRGRHVIAIVVTHDSVAMEIALTQQIFGRRIPELAAVTGDGDSHYDVVLCGEQEEYTLGHGTNPAGSLRSRRSPLPTR